MFKTPKIDFAIFDFDFDFVHFPYLSMTNWKIPQIKVMRIKSSSAKKIFIRNYYYYYYGVILFYPMTAIGWFRIQNRAFQKRHIASSIHQAWRYAYVMDVHCFEIAEQADIIFNRARDDWTGPQCSHT